MFQRAESVLGAQSACVFRPALVQRTHSFDSHSALNQTVPALHVRMQQQPRLLLSQASGSLPSSGSSCIGICDDSLNSCAWYGSCYDVVWYCLAVVGLTVFFCKQFQWMWIRHFSLCVSCSLAFVICGLCLGWDFWFKFILSQKIISSFVSMLSGWFCFAFFVSKIVVLMQQKPCLF